MAKNLHTLSVEASKLSASILGSKAEVYAAEVTDIAQMRKAGFLGLEVANRDATIYREDLAAAEIQDTELLIGNQIIRAQSADVITLAQVALLATDADEFTAEDAENIALPADAGARHKLAARISNFAADLKKTQDRVLAIMEEIDEVVAEGLGLTATENEIIHKRCQEFPLSVTVERPRFSWSPDRKRQARRTYRPGQRFK